MRCPEHSDTSYYGVRQWTVVDGVQSYSHRCLMSNSRRLLKKLNKREAFVLRIRSATLCDHSLDRPKSSRSSRLGAPEECFLIDRHLDLDWALSNKLPSLNLWRLGLSLFHNESHPSFCISSVYIFMPLAISPCVNLQWVFSLSLLWTKTRLFIKIPVVFRTTRL